MRPMRELGAEALRNRSRAICTRWSVLPSGTLGWNKAEVTIGGVDTGGLSSKTMDGDRVAGLYFIGEVVDVTGWLGGYNFQWAWASGSTRRRRSDAPGIRASIVDVAARRLAMLRARISLCRRLPLRRLALPRSAQVKIGLMVSSTGPTTAIGIPQKNTGDLLPRRIGDATVEYFQLDDGGDTTRAVQNIKKLIQENNIDAMIGPSTTPNALAILDIIAEAKVPVMATVGTSSVVEPLDAKRRWVYKTTQNDDLIAAALIKHMLKNSVKTVGFIGFNDPYGENWLKVFGGLAEKAGIRLVAVERYDAPDRASPGRR